MQLSWPQVVNPRKSAEPLAAFAFVAYTLLIALNMSVHVVWSDEADPWVMARSGTLHDWLHYASYTGHPPFWLSLLTITARVLGAPVQGMLALNAMLSIAVAWLILYRSPFSAWLRVLVLFSFTFAYQYSLVARGYMLMTLMLLLVTLYYPQRNTRPKLYGVLLALLFHTESFVMLPTGLLVVQFMWENRRSSWTGPAIAAIGSAMGAAWLLPWDGIEKMQSLYRLDAKIYDGFMMNLGRAFMSVEVMDAIKPYIGNPSYGSISMMIPRSLPGILLLFGLWRCIHWRGRWFMLAWLSGLFVIFTCVYRGQIWHAQKFLVFTLWTLWLCHQDGWTPVRQKALAAALLFILPLSSLSAYTILIKHWETPFSGGEGVAAYLREHGQEGTTLITLLCFTNSPVAAYLPTNDYWFSGQNRLSQYVIWGAFHDRCQEKMNQVTPEVVKMVREKGEYLLLAMKQPRFPPQLEAQQLLYSHGIRENYLLYRVRFKN